MKKILNYIFILMLMVTPSLLAQSSGLPSLPATSSTLGSIKPDNSSIVVGPTGILSSIGSQPASQYIAPQALAGCGVEYVSGLTYTVGACTYSINGTVYNSSLSNVTLAAADPTNPRIDVIFVDTTQTVQSITGTPAATPQQPVVDPSTQLELTFVLVPATATTPANTTTVNIYLEGTEWTGSVGGTNSARVNLTSTNNPYLGTHDTEFGVGGTVTTTTFSQYTDPAAGTVNMSNYNALVFYVRNKAAWPKARSVTVQWYSGSTPTGIPVVLSNGAFGFNATTNITAYQQVSIPASTFGIPGVPVTSLRFTVSGSGVALTGFYLDQATLQGGNGPLVFPSTLMNFKGAWSATATYATNDTVTSGGIGYVALAANTNVAVTTTATWRPLAPAGTSGTVTNIATTGPIGGGPITTNGSINCTTCVTSAASLNNNALMLGAGSQASAVLGSLGTTTTVLHGNVAGAPSFGAVANADLANPSTTVNGQTCTLGSICTVTAVATAMPFSGLSSATNSTAAMVVGTGASLATSGSGTITATAAPLSGITGLGTGVGTFLGSPSSANLAAAITDETGTGVLVFDTSATLTTPVLNTSVTGTALQGTDTKLLTAGTVSGTAVTLCTDANGGATTSGCSSGGGSIPYIATTGSVNAMVATFSPAITSYTTGLLIAITANISTTATAPTINVNGLGAKSITKYGSGLLASGDISTSTVTLLMYNGATFDLQNPQAQIGPNSLGTAAAPALSFAAAPNYGLFAGSGFTRIAANTIDIFDCNVGTCVTNGSNIAQHVFDTSLTLGNCVQVGGGDTRLTSIAIPCYVPPTATTATATGGTGITSVTCATAACTNQRGTFTVVGGTATTGTIFTLAWTATSTAYVCIVSENGGGSPTPTFFGIGHNVATTTGVVVTAGISVIGSTFTVDYACQP